MAMNNEHEKKNKHEHERKKKNKEREKRNIDKNKREKRNIDKDKEREKRNIDKDKEREKREKRNIDKDKEREKRNIEKRNIDKDKEREKRNIDKNKEHQCRQISSSMEKIRTCPNNHELMLKNNCKRDCAACEKQVKGFVYHCHEKDLVLHPCCRLSKTESKCARCNQIKGWSYMGNCGKYNFHVDCMREILLEFVRKKGKSTSNEDLSLETSKPKRDSGMSQNLWKMAEVILRFIAIFIGDPTGVLAILGVDFIREVVSAIYKRKTLKQGRSKRGSRGGNCPP